MMKKFLTVSMIIAALFAVSCSENDTGTDPTTTKSSSTTLTLTAAAGNVSLGGDKVATVAITGTGADSSSNVWNIAITRGSSNSEEVTDIGAILAEKLGTTTATVDISKLTDTGFVTATLAKGATAEIEITTAFTAAGTGTPAGTITVTAEDGTTTAEYFFKVTVS